MINSKNNEIANGVFVRNLTDSKFKTMRVSMNFILPLELETVSSYALIPSIITQATKEHPSISLLSKHLAGLYGASLSSSVSNMGDNQILSVSSQGVSDRFALENENLSEIFTHLVCKSVFTPLVDDDGELTEDGFNQEKRQMLESIQADFNDKIVYAKDKCREIMFCNEAYGIGRCGNQETVSKAQRKGLKDKLKFIIENARVEIFVSGDCNFEAVKNVFASYFSQIRKDIVLTNEIDPVVKELKVVTEEMKLSQSKLSMGFRSSLSKDKMCWAKLMCVIFGGSPSSKLFLNVREKLSLCYYCSSVFDSQKAVMFINSGVESKNIEIAKEAILNEFEDMKKGNFTDDDIKFAKLAMYNGYNSIDDSLAHKEVWYLTQVLFDKFVSPEEMMKEVSQITREQIVEAANSIELDTVFILKGVSENE